jgi:hypothetical protein
MSIKKKLRYLLQSKAPVDCLEFQSQILFSFGLGHKGTSFYVTKKGKQYRLEHYSSRYKQKICEPLTKTEFIKLVKIGQKIAKRPIPIVYLSMKKQIMLNQLLKLLPLGKVRVSHFDDDIMTSYYIDIDGGSRLKQTYFDIKIHHNLQTIKMERMFLILDTSYIMQTYISESDMLKLLDILKPYMVE